MAVDDYGINKNCYLFTYSAWRWKLKFGVNYDPRTSSKKSWACSTFDAIFTERWNLFTGSDNGLGKTFLLDIVWWALTGTWAGNPGWPQRIKGAKVQGLYRPDRNVSKLSITLRWYKSICTYLYLAFTYTRFIKFKLKYRYRCNEIPYKHCLWMGPSNSVNLGCLRSSPQTSIDFLCDAEVFLWWVLTAHSTL